VSRPSASVTSMKYPGALSLLSRDDTEQHATIEPSSHTGTQASVTNARKAVPVGGPSLEVRHIHPSRGVMPTSPFSP